MVATVFDPLGWCPNDFVRGRNKVVPGSILDFFVIGESADANRQFTAVKRIKLKMNTGAAVYSATRAQPRGTLHGDGSSSANRRVPGFVFGRGGGGSI